MGAINTRRLLGLLQFVALAFIGALQASFLYLGWAFHSSSNRPCKIVGLDMFCGATTPQWVLTVQMVVPFAYLLLVIVFLIIGVRQLNRDPKARNWALWALVAIEILFILWLVLRYYG